MSTITTQNAEAVVSMTVKLKQDRRDRLKSLSAAKQRTPHYMVLEAIDRYIEDEEREIQWVRAAERAADHYEETGLHITLGEVKAWAEKVKKDRNAKLPVCHK